MQCHAAASADIPVLPARCSPLCSGPLLLKQLETIPVCHPPAHRLDLRPIPLLAGSISGITPLRHDALEAVLAHVAGDEADQDL
jgi:hypothetical protein